jgi:TP901 family phage tail tape measure protein
VAVARRADLDLSARLVFDDSGFERKVKDAGSSASVFERHLAALDREADRAQKSVMRLAEATSRDADRAMRGATTAMGATERAMRELDRELEKGSREFEKLAKAQAAARRELLQSSEEIGQGMLVAGAAMAAGLGLATHAAMEWESAFAGVRKTMAPGTDFAALEEQLRGLALTMPVAATELAAIAESAGALGIRSDAVIGFTRVMATLGATTDLTSEQAANAFARIATVTQTSQDDFDNMAAAVVALGNSGASTESEITEMALRLAGAGETANMSTADILGMASALSSVGLTAEAGGGALSRSIALIQQSVAQGGEELEEFARVAGMSGEEFRKLFNRDSTQAITAYVTGLGRVRQAGEDVYASFDAVGIKDSEMRRALLLAANAGDTLTASIKKGNEAWEQNIAHVKEANERYKTSESRLLIARNQLNDMAIDVGAELLPAVVSAGEAVGDLATFFTGLPEPVQDAVVALGVLTTAATLAGGAILSIGPKIAATRAAIATLAAVAPGGAAALGLLGAAAGGLGVALTLVVAPVAAVIATAAGLAYAFSWVQGAAGWKHQAADVTELTTSMAEYVAAGRDAGQMADSFGPQMKKFRESFDDIANPDFDERWVRMFDKVTPWNTSMENNLGLVKEWDAAFAHLVESGAPDVAAEMVKRLGISAEDSAEHLPEYNKRLAETESAAKKAAEAHLESLDPGLRAVAESVGLTGEPLEKYLEKIKEIAQELDAFSSPIGVYQKALQDKQEAERKSFEQTIKGTEDAAKAWEGFKASTELSLSQYADALEKDNEAQTNWQKNLVTVAGRAGVEVAEILRQMGPEAAGLVADMATGTDAEMQRVADALIENARFGSDEAGKELDLGMKVMEGIARIGADKTVQVIAERLGVGVADVRRIAEQYGITLTESLNPLLISLGKDPVYGRTARGKNPGYIPELAEGGLLTGPGTGTSDSILGLDPATLAPTAWVSNGEYVVNAQQTARYLPILQAINAGMLAAGGLVRRLAVGGFLVPDDVPRPPSTAPYGPPISTAADRTMDVGYRATRDFVARNAIPPGGVGLAGQPMGVQQMMAVINGEYGATRLISGLRPGAITATGRPSYHGMGRAVDLPPNMALFNFLRGRFPNARELIFSPAGNRQINNGRPHVYSGITRAMHYDHIHLAMRNGGLVGRAAGGYVPVGGRLQPAASPAISTEAQARLDAYRDQIVALDELRDREALLAAMRATGAEWARVEAAFHASRNEEERGRLAEEHARLSEEGVRQRERLAQMDQEAARTARQIALEKQLADVEAREDVAEARRELAADRLDTLREYLQEQQQVTSRLADARRQFESAVAEAREALQQRVADLRAARVDELRAWAALTEPVEVTWASSVRAIAGNVQAQVEQFEEWTRRLAEARARGVSEDVVRALGLDQGPQALGQLRQFSTATQTEIDALNDAVGRQRSAAEAQAAAESANGLTRLGESLIAVTEETNEQVAELHADFAETERQALADLAAIGSDGALAYGQAIADGLASSLPAIQAQARLVQQAMRGLTGDEAAQVGGNADLSNRIRDIFANRGVSLSAGAQAGESEAARLARLVAEVKGGRTLDSVRSSVDWLRTQTVREPTVTPAVQPVVLRLEGDLAPLVTAVHQRTAAGEKRILIQRGR